MSDTHLSVEKILDTAEQVLRRYGPNKTTVVDVARALEVSHGTVYRHFASKAALKEAVAERWLHRVSAPLAVIAEGTGSATERLHLMLETLFHLKRVKVLDDTEMFAMYSVLVEETVDVVKAHVDGLIALLKRIVEDGITGGEFRPGDPGSIATAIFSATTRFHHPSHAKEWSVSTIDEQFEAVMKLINAGIARY